MVSESQHGAGSRERRPRDQPRFSAQNRQHPHTVSCGCPQGPERCSPCPTTTGSETGGARGAGLRARASCHTAPHSHAVGPCALCVLCVCSAHRVCAACVLCVCTCTTRVVSVCALCTRHVLWAPRVWGTEVGLTGLPGSPSWFLFLLLPGQVRPQLMPRAGGAGGDCAELPDPDPSRNPEAPGRKPLR